MLVQERCYGVEALDFICQRGPPIHGRVLFWMAAFELLILRALDLENQILLSPRSRGARMKRSHEARCTESLKIWIPRIETPWAAVGARCGLSMQALRSWPSNVDVVAHGQVSRIMQN